MRGAPEHRFWSKVMKTPECWYWVAGRRSGYGAFGWAAGDVRPAHRVAYELLVGPIPEGAVLRHSCDQRSCVNPAHLRPGTQAENVHDAVSRDRVVHGDRHPRHRITATHVRAVRELYATGGWTLRELGDLFGVNEGHVSLIVRGLKWRRAKGPTVARDQWRGLRHAARRRDRLGRFAAMGARTCGEVEP